MADQSAPQPFNFTPPSPTASYQGVIGALKNPVPSISSFLPEIQNYLSQSSQFLQPSIDALKQNQGFNMADLQGAMGARGLAGSSIDAQAQATQGGMNQQALAQMLGNFSMQGANTFANMDFQGRNQDITNALGLNQQLAGSAGQELSSQRSMQMFQDQLSQMLSMANSASNTALWGAGIGALGSLGGGAIAKYSDVRLKENIRPIGKLKGHTLYAFNYRHEKYPELDLPKGKQIGLISQEVEQKEPGAVGERNGYGVVDYSKLRGDK